MAADRYTCLSELLHQTEEACWSMTLLRSDAPAHSAPEMGQDMTEKVTLQEVQRVAELAHLELAPEETPRMLRDLNAILEYVAELNELNTAGVAPLAQVSELFDENSTELRADQLQPSLDRSTVLAQAPDSDTAFFRVPKVIER